MKRLLTTAIALFLLALPAMAGRDGSGTYSVPHTATSGAVISSDDWNDNFDDVGDEITNSLPRDGQVGMTGQFKASAGSVSAPGIAFSGDLNSGFYSIGADNWGLALNGTKVVDFSASTVAITGNVTISGSISAGSGLGANPFPVGSVMAYAGTTEPSGWVLCYGQELNRTTYASLFTAIGTTYGSGDGSTTFNVPDLRGRVIAGQDDMGGSSANRLTGLTNGVNGDTLGGTGGEESHTLTTAEMPSHTHTGTTDSSGSHNHSEEGVQGNGQAEAGTGKSVVSSDNNNTSTDGAHTHTFTTAASGSGGAHNLIQPTIIVNYIIYTGV